MEVKVSGVTVTELPKGCRVRGAENRLYSRGDSEFTFATHLPLSLPLSHYFPSGLQSHSLTSRMESPLTCPRSFCLQDPHMVSTGWNVLPLCLGDSGSFKAEIIAPMLFTAFSILPAPFLLLYFLRTPRVSIFVPHHKLDCAFTFSLSLRLDSQFPLHVI